MTSSVDIDAAAARLASRVRRTPVLRFDHPAIAGAAGLALKLEFLQHTGSFKPRGAFNAMLAEPPPTAGVAAASGGNHGAAVAYAARELGVRATIFVPTTTPSSKLARISAHGAELVRVGETYAAAREASVRYARETGAREVHAYDNARVIAGQGTVGRELEQDAPELTHILVATGGGGLIGGIAAWYAGRAAVISVEPAGCPCLHAALAKGAPVVAPVGGIAADSLGASQVGTLAFSLARAHVADAVLVADTDIRRAQRFLWDEARLLVEPGGATALAALLAGAFKPPPGARVGVVLCGANTDPTQPLTDDGP